MHGFQCTLDGVVVVRWVRQDLMVCESILKSLYVALESSTLVLGVYGAILKLAGDTKWARLRQD